MICLILIVQMLTESAQACPEMCICKWKNGKQTVECPDKNLSEIPHAIDPTTQVLDFSGNNLIILDDELFLRKQLTNLQRIYMARCMIRLINNRTFKGLTNLIELDLSANRLENVPTTAFFDCPSLMRLTLSSNPIRILNRYAFNHLSYLSTLELSRCELSEIEEDAFASLQNLEWLTLNGNRLKTINVDRILPASLKGVELQDNPWECDCRIVSMHAWVNRFNIPMSVEPICTGPMRLARRLIKTLNPTELACLPEIHPTTFYLELAEGKNLTLSCHVKAIPEAIISWWFDGQMLQNNTNIAPGFHLVYYVEEGNEEKRSDLFIYNANVEDNGTFICNAENPAGTTQSNFTIRIILKKEPKLIVVTLPFEYMVYSAIGVCAFGIFLIVIIVASVTRCLKRSKKIRGKTEYPKSVEAVLPESSKFDEGQIEIAVSSVLPQTTTVTRDGLERNPDLINGTESVLREGGDGEEIVERETASGDVRWDFGIACVVDPEGYPIDYGLPKAAYRIRANESYYVTLPSAKRARKLRYHHETEFIETRPVVYDYYTNVRYTADGYPARPIVNAPHEICDNAPSSLPCCSAQWPASVPANFHIIECDRTVGKRCVGAQTDSQQNRNDLTTESPDEGYGGEPSVV